MGTAYTPGLKVSARTTIEKLRRLPLKGQVLLKEGDVVEPDTVVARAEIPGILQTIKLAEKLGVEPSDLPGLLQLKLGDRIERGALLAQSKGLFGMFKSEERSPYEGTLEIISEHTGHLGIRQKPASIERYAYVRGTVIRVLPNEGVVVRCEGAMIQGIFGVGGERQGVIALAASESSEPLTDAGITSVYAGKIVVGGSNVSGAALRKAADVGVVGIVVGGVVDQELIGYLRQALGDPNYDIGVAITGQEPIPFSLIITEGFGTIPMPERTFNLLKSLEGKAASINGATQIRAGVIRPEVIVPMDDSSTPAQPASEVGQLSIGTPIRVIREPFFGALGAVTALPSALIQVESETWVRVLESKLQDGRIVTVPRANVEIMEGA